MSNPPLFTIATNRCGQELSLWGSLYKTSWFRVAVTLVGLLVKANSKTQYNEDQTVAVGFSSRPRGFEKTIGHFANALPVKIPIWEELTRTSGEPTLQSLVKAVSNNISKAKRAERFTMLDIAASSRTQKQSFFPPKVAVTYSPRLADQQCNLYPVEGAWDLFFCFLEQDSKVDLGVNLKNSNTVWVRS